MKSLWDWLDLFSLVEDTELPRKISFSVQHCMLNPQAKNTVVAAQVSDAAIEIALIRKCPLLFSSQVWVNRLLFTGFQKTHSSPQRPQAGPRCRAAPSRVTRFTYQLLQQQCLWCPRLCFWPMVGVAMVQQHTLSCINAL